MEWLTNPEIWIAFFTLTALEIVLAKENINILMISTSEIKVSVVIEEKYLELAVRSLHTAFDLDAPDRQGE